MGTLTINTGLFLGSPQVQPVPSDTVIPPPGVSTGDTVVRIQRSILVASEPQQSPTLNLTSLVPLIPSQLMTMKNVIKTAGDPGIVFSLPTKLNVITPSYVLTSEPGSYDPAKIDATVFSTKKFDPYEQLTGISQERPEIVMMTGYLPLFTHETNKANESTDQAQNSGFYPFMTPAGRYMDAQLQARNLTSMNMAKVVMGLKDHFFNFPALYTNRQQSFISTIDDLSDVASFLLTLIKGMNRLKQQLDLRDDLYDVESETVARTQLSRSNIVSPSALESRLSGVKKFLPATYTLADALLSLGFNGDAVKSVFSSTKIWLQLLLDLKIILQSHSLDFVDVVPTSRQNDKSSASILRDDVKRFGFGNNILVPKLDTIINVPVSDLSNILSVINQDFQNIYEDTVIKSDEIKIAALVNLISKEFNYSVGLSQQSTQRLLFDGFGFKSAQNGNQTVFDAILGQIGHGISDVPANETNSLSAVSQRQLTNNEIVLTFESKYVVGDSGTLTPGSRFFIDQVLKTDGVQFDTSRLDDLALQLEGTHDNFSSVISSLNLLPQSAGVSPDNLDFRSVLTSPIDFLKYILDHIVDITSGETLDQIKNDNIGAIYSQAKQDNKIKSILFMYAISRISRSYGTDVPSFHANLLSDNTPVSDALIEKLLVALQNNVIETKSSTRSFLGVSGINTTISLDAIRASIKNGTPLTNFIENILGKVLAAFRADNAAIIDGKTRFGGDVDTSIMLVVFDLLVNTIAKFNNQTIVSFSPAVLAGVDSLVINKTVDNNASAITDLTTRIDKELALTQKLTYAALNALKNLSVAVQNFGNYLRKSQSVVSLKKVASVFSDPSMLQMFLSEQQIMLLASTIYDLKANTRGKTITDSTDQFLVLDNSNVTPELQQALYGLLGNVEFTLAKGFNKKILTVGIPLGFSNHLIQSVKLNNLKKTSFVNKQSDIVSVVVYKSDLKNPDVIYKPQRFLFELSRFPARGQRGIQDIPTNPTIDDVINAIPTRDFNQSLGSGYDVTYGTIGGDPVVEGFKTAFSDEAYSFLSDAQKTEIIRNHVISYLMEVYVSLMTGINVGDHHFDLVDQLPTVEPDFITVLTDHRIRQVADPSIAKNAVNQGDHVLQGGVLFSTTLPPTTLATMSKQDAQMSTSLSNTSGIAGIVSIAKQFGALAPTQTSANTNFIKQTIEQADVNLASAPQRVVSGLVTDMRLINEFSRTVTTLSNGLLLSKRLLQPKQFDRVFNVIVDPDSFQIDYDTTVKSTYGKQALEQMIVSGEVVPEEQSNQIFRRILARNISERTFQYNRPVSIAGSVLYHDRDKVPGDLAFEKYFVTIETLDESEQI